METYLSALRYPFKPRENGSRATEVAGCPVASLMAPEGCSKALAGGKPVGSSSTARAEVAVTNFELVHTRSGSITSSNPSPHHLAKRIRVASKKRAPIPAPCKQAQTA